MQGIHFIGQGACQTARQTVLDIQMEATLDELARAIFPHPTLSESVAEAARECLIDPFILPNQIQKPHYTNIFPTCFHLE